MEHSIIQYLEQEAENEQFIYDRSLDVQMVQLWLSRFNPSDRPIADAFIHSIQHIPFESTKQELFNNYMNCVIDNNNNTRDTTLGILLENLTGKKSTNFFSALVYKYCIKDQEHSENVRFLLNTVDVFKRNPDIHNYILIDDMAYSGSQMEDTIWFMANSFYMDEYTVLVKDSLNDLPSNKPVYHIHAHVPTFLDNLEVYLPRNIPKGHFLPIILHNTEIDKREHKDIRTIVYIMMYVDDHNIFQKSKFYSIKEFMEVYETFREYIFYDTNMDELCVKKITTHKKDKNGKMLFFVDGKIAQSKEEFKRAKPEIATQRIVKLADWEKKFYHEPRMRYGKYTINICFAYITEKAQIRLENFANRMRTESCVFNLYCTVPDMSTQIFVDKFSGEQKKKAIRFINLYSEIFTFHIPGTVEEIANKENPELHSDQSMTYFDHKLASPVSAFTSILQCGLVISPSDQLQQMNIYTVGPLINIYEADVPYINSIPNNCYETLQRLYHYKELNEDIYPEKETKYNTSRDENTFTILPKPAYKLPQEDKTRYRQTNHHRMPLSLVNPPFRRIEDKYKYTNVSRK